MMLQKCLVFHLTKKQKTLPPALQKQILKKKGKKSEDDSDEEDDSKDKKKDDSEASLWENIHKKRERIKKGSGEKMRKKGDKGAPTPEQLKKAKDKTAKAEYEMTDEEFAEVMSVEELVLYKNSENRIFA
jgi:hypothetical protein